MSGFGARLARFVEVKGLDISDTEDHLGLSLEAVIDGFVPSAVAIGQLAPMLGLHVQDVYVLTGVAVPVDLAPLDPAAGVSAINIAFAAMSLPEDGIRRLRQLIESLPKDVRTKPVSPPRQYGPGPGSILLGMLTNRNLAPHRTAKALYLGTRGGIYLSETTIQQALVRDRQLTPGQFAGFASVLGILASDLAILTGFSLPLPDMSGQETPKSIVELLWDACRLSAQQARYVADVARLMLKEG